MLFRFAPVAAAGLLMIASSACSSSSRSYPANKADDAYDLGAMSLRDGDLPAGLVPDTRLDDHSFDNERWANDVLNADDPGLKVTSLEANGRVTSYLSVFHATNYSRVLGVWSISTLYKTPDDALAAQFSGKDRKIANTCGLPIDDTTELQQFAVPAIGDSTVGFISKADVGNGQTLSDANICFRTGRILHVVQVTGAEGFEDIALDVNLARAMLQHVNDAFDGNTPAATATPTGKLAPLTPGANGTAAPKATPGR